MIILAIMTGLPGGLIRDVVLQQGLPIALTNPAYPVTAITGAIAAHLIYMRSRSWRYGFAVADAVALGCWASAGTIKALGAGLGCVPAILLGVMTAVGGGILVLWKGSSLALGDVQVRASQGRRGRDTGSYPD